MKLVIDLQGAQTESRFRGIGRQARALATAIIKHAAAHDTFILLNSAMPVALDETMQEFEALLPRSHIKLFHGPSDVREIHSANLWRMRAAELVREAYIADLRADIVHVSSLFEGVSDDAVTSIGLMQAPHLTAATLFDLIPLFDVDAYLGADFMRRFYYRRAQSLKRADLLIAISESARREAMEMLQIPGDRIDVALLAADDIFRKSDISESAQSELRHKYKLPPKFIFYVGAIEERKNVALIIEAFGKLPPVLQAQYWLVFGGRLHEPQRLQLRTAAVRHDVDLSRIVFTGYIEDADLPSIYSICDLFVFPSIHEGFGFPPVEAMACGAPVLSARNTSLPEVMGRDDLMFGTYDAADLAAKMQRILTDVEYAASIRQWGLQQAAKFSWDKSGVQSLQSLERLFEKHKHQTRTSIEFRRRPRLAFISPLPNDRTGIANYSAELIRELARFYDLECVISGTVVTDPWITANFPLRDVDYFRRNANSYDRILYSIGNSSYHVHMLDLLEVYPGVVIMHDFFLSGVLDWLGNVHQRPPEDFMRHLYQTHGLPALDYAAREGREAAARRYAANDCVFSNAYGVIVHSKAAMARAIDVYGHEISSKIQVAPHLRAALPHLDRAEARRRLGILPNAFVVCSFGFIADTKLSDRLFDAWMASSTGKAADTYLVFVGENIGGPWGDVLARAITAQSGRFNVEITGYVNGTTYHDYLAAADVAVQLRKDSRGETSGSILDCMAAGLPLILNAHGTAAEIDSDAVIRLPDEFSKQQLADALDKLFKSPEARTGLGARARQEIIDHYHPALVGEQIHRAIETFTLSTRGGNNGRLLESLRELSAPVYPDDQDFRLLAIAMSRNAGRIGLRRILYDVTLFAETDAHTGIERVVRGILGQILLDPPSGYRVEPVRIDGNQLRFARAFTSRRLGIPATVLPDSPVDTDAGDIYVTLEWAADRLPNIADWLMEFRRRGGRVVIGIHDLLPMQIPHRFPSYIPGVAQIWFETVLRVADQIICVSRCVADDVLKYGNGLTNSRNRPIDVDYFHSSPDIASSLPTKGMTDQATRLLAEFKKRKTFLMVGTVEPRKGHALTVQAFHYLWAKRVDVGLVIVGKKGWAVDDVDRMIAKSPERDKRLFWLSNVSDEFLERIYSSATALIAASEAEGFGLPLVEAARRKVPLVVRDIPVFHEVAGDNAFYFKAKTPQEMGEEIVAWLALERTGKLPDPSKVKVQTWRESARQFFDATTSETHYGRIDPFKSPG